MVFSYYSRLTRSQQRVYRQSDGVKAIALPSTVPLRLLLEQMAQLLERGDHRGTEAVCQRLLSALTAALKVCSVRVRVMQVRPARSWGELHGLYKPGLNRRSAQITLWMRTAQRHQVVAFRTFLRTLLHELCHHLDYELLKLRDSFHTEGFYKRESSLFHQLSGR